MAYLQYVGKPFLYVLPHPSFPCSPIKSNFHLSVTVLALTAFALALRPYYAEAFWPFSSHADAEAGVLIPSSTTPVLAAALNSDPNASLPPSLSFSGNAILAQSGPEGTIADVAGSAPSDRISIYVVRPGDTLSEIADMFGVSVNTIIWANNLSGVKDVRPGQTLVILPISGTKHTVAKGDTLKSIAKKYKADANEIAQFNGLDPAEGLAVGSTIIIPGGEIAPPAPTKPRRGSPSRRTEPYLGGGGSLQSGYYANPVPGALLTQGIHGWNAIDLGAARGTPIRAAADGTVIIARNGGWNGGYGNYVVITHDNGTQTLYGHMTNAIVSPGQSVSAGQVIGYLGSTGESTGPHLHFEVRGAANPFRACRVNSVCSPQ